MGRGNPRAVSGTHTTPIGDELMVHVVGTAETHLLGPTTAAVWARCDGTTSRASLEDVFADQPAELRPELVQLALDQLERTGLVEDGGSSTDLQRESRRRFLRRAAIAAVTVPTITTVVTAQPAAAHSHDCNRTGCTGGQVCDPPTGQCFPCSAQRPCPGTQRCVAGVCREPSRPPSVSSTNCTSPSQDQFTVTGTGVNGSTINLYAGGSCGGVLLGTAVVQNSGWSITATTTGTMQVSVSQTEPDRAPSDCVGPIAVPSQCR